MHSVTFAAISQAQLLIHSRTDFCKSTTRFTSHMSLTGTQLVSYINYDTNALARLGVSDGAEIGGRSGDGAEVEGDR